MKILDESTIDEFITRLEDLERIWPGEDEEERFSAQAETGMTGWLRSIGVRESIMLPITQAHPKATIGLIADKWTHGSYSRIASNNLSVFKEIQSLVELGFIAGYVWAHARDES